MKKRVIVLILIAAVFLFSSEAFALTVTAKSTSSVNYEDGQTKPAGGVFKANYVIDEEKGTITLTKILENSREGRFAEGNSYEIVSVLESKGPSALMVSREKTGQKIYTAVREGYMGSFETLIMGQDFYEYANAANGKFYLENGEVTRPKR